MTSSGQRVGFDVTAIEAWAPGLNSAADWRAWCAGELAIGTDGTAALTQMPAMLRRHAGRLGRAACDVAYRALGERADVPTVFSSRYGEMDRAVALLTALADGKELSPTSFSLSVHNAIGGLLSMARSDSANVLALAGGDDLAEIAVLEACGLLADGAGQVLVVVAECPLPDVYQHFELAPPAAFAWACMLESGGEPALSLSWEAWERATDARPSQAGALEVLPFLLGHAQATLRHAEGRRWHWQRHA
jgi:hypothetical protein